MKRIIVILLFIILILGGAFAYSEYQSRRLPDSPAVADAQEAAMQDPAEVPAEAASMAAEAVSESETGATATGGLQMDQMDYETLKIDQLFATRSPEETVLTINGKAENWGDYFYFLSSQVDHVENMLVQLYANYGAELLWSDTADGEGNTYADLAVDGAENNMLRLAAIEAFADEHKVELTEESRAALAQQLELDIKSFCGEDATEADFEQYLAARHLSRALYDRINTDNMLYQAGLWKLYGENGEAVGEEAALQYLKDNGYVSANHILLMTVDPVTGEKLDDAAIADKTATAKRLAEELQAIKEPEELQRRFAQLKEEFCEDSGKTVYAAGYTFTPHTMVAEFENACKELDNYEVSDPVLSSYGYHIIMKLPPDADALLFSRSSEPVTARVAVATAEYGELLQTCMDGLKVEYAEGFEKPNLLDYIKD